MKTIDTRGLRCPQPLIRTREALKTAQPGDLFTLFTDNETALGNLQSYLKELGAETTATAVPGGWEIAFAAPAQFRGEVNAEAHCSAPVRNDYITVFKSERMGSGDDELGAILMRGYVNALAQSDPLPAAVVLYNGGVKLALQGRDTAEALSALEAKGVPVYACGTCLDFYGVKEQIAAGTVSNLFKIIELTGRAGHVVYP